MSQPSGRSAARRRGRSLTAAQRAQIAARSTPATGPIRPNRSIPQSTASQPFLPDRYQQQQAAFNRGEHHMSQGIIPPWLERDLRGVGANAATRLIGGGASSTAAPQLMPFTPGSDIEIMGEAEARAAGLLPRRRRRRRRLLTCQDKADIAFLHGQLGSGALGKAAISAVLSRRCG